jgi:2-oxoglutarate ferredoxin oxidoreductase subunit gamma
LIIDTDLVTVDEQAENHRILSIPATRIAEEMGQRVVANIVMLGFLATVTDLVSIDAMREAALTSIPKKTIELNTRAFEAGLEHGRKAMAAGVSG